MTFDEVLAQVIELLRREGRLSYRALKRRFSLDDEYLEDLKTEIIDAKRLGVDENGTVLVWVGAAQTTSEPRANVQTESRAAPSTSASDEGERRQLTVMFCDLVSSTALSEQFDPEELRDLIRAYQHACSAVITRFDGRIAKYLGDGLLAYFGYPRAHEDDARRAVRAALGILAAMEALNAEHSRHPLLQPASVPDSFARLRSAAPSGPPPHQKMRDGTAGRKPVSLKVRLGIHTGLVVVGEMGSSDFREQAAIVGDTPNTADRLQELAEPDTAVISGATYQLVQGLFDCEALGARGLKGVSTPIHVYRVLRESDAQSRFEVAIQAGLTPLVGRENESAILNECWERAQNGEGQVVLLSGEPGIGKSRLVHAFKEHTASEGGRWLECHCSPYHQNTAHFPIIDLLQRLLEFESLDDSAMKLSKLERGLRKHDLPIADYLPLLSPLLSLPAPEEYPRLTLTLEAQKEKTHLAIQTWLLAIAERAGLVFVFEDLHWVDPSTLELLGPLLEEVPTTRMLSVLTYRPEFAPPWPVRSHFVTIALRRLPRTQSEVVVRNVSGGKPLPTQVLEQIISKTDGVPLFVEELTKAVLESNLLRERDDRYELTGPLPPLAIPSTLHDSLTARLDRLGSVREVAQLAAALGRDFSYDLLRAIAPLDDGDLRKAMAALVDAEVLYRRGVIPQARYFFKHALIRDAAYESLLKSRRQQVHARVARVLEEQFPEAVETQPELIAQHYAAAALHANAIPHLQRAGKQALVRAANREAINHFERAIGLFEASRSQGGSTLEGAITEQTLGELFFELGWAHFRAGQYLSAREAFLRAATSARVSGSTELFVRSATEHGLVTDAVNLPAAPAIELLEEALQRLGSEETPIKAKALGYLSRALANNGMHERALAYGKQAVEIARRFVDERSVVEHAQELIEARNGIITVLQSPEYARERLVYLNEYIEIAGRAGLYDSPAVNSTYYWRAVALAELGEMDAADKDADETVRLADRYQMPFPLSLGVAYRAMRAMTQGRFADSEQLAQEAFGIAQRLQIENAAGVLGLQIFTLRREQGRLKEVAPAVRHFVQQKQRAATWRPGLAVIYTELGNAIEARALFEELAQHNFEDLPRDSLWMTSITYLVDVCTFLGDTRRAAILYKALLPYEDCNVCGANAFVCFGAMARYLGTLAATLGHWNDAEHHFEHALDMNARMGARPWLAHTQYQYARMLLSRDQPGDSDRAATLLKEALAKGRELGMRALEQRITSGAP